MVHSFFETIANEPYLANKCAEKASHCPNPTRSFTQVFSIFFPDYGQLDYDVESWLEVIAEGFEFDKKNEDRFTIWEVEKLFRRYGFHPKHSDNVNVFSFWLYLVWVYKKLLKEGYNRDDNIFRFMEGCSISDVKVVIMGNDPCKDVPSSGYAFHESVCPSTRKILEFVDNEIEIVCEHLDDYRMSLHDNEFNVAAENCNLWGWIQQGVLLLNSRLTFEGDDDLREAWEIFTDFILEYLSDQGNIVFLFLGVANGGKANLVDEDNRNIIMKLYHPAHYTFPEARTVRRNMDWNSRLPFINANFCLWQAHGRDEQHIIDWSSIGWVKKRTAKRRGYWNDFFVDVTNNCGWLPTGSQMYFSDFLVQRNGDGFLTLEMTDVDKQ